MVIGADTPTAHRLLLEIPPASPARQIRPVGNDRRDTLPAIPPRTPPRRTRRTRPDPKAHSLLRQVHPITDHLIPTDFRTGQIYHTLLKAREERGVKDIAISRIEQLSPFPYDLLTPHLDKYPNAELMYCQVRP